jgi:hypothetical protein
VLHRRRRWLERTRRTLGSMQVVTRACCGEESRPQQQEQQESQPASFACCGQECLPASYELIALLETTLWR